MGCAATAKGFNDEGTGKGRDRRVHVVFRACRREVSETGKRQEGRRGRVAHEGRCVGGDRVMSVCRRLGCAFAVASLSEEVAVVC